MVVVDAMKPLQRPSLQVLYAHWSSKSAEKEHCSPRATVPVAFAGVEVVAEGMKPLQSPSLQVLYAHCESDVQLA